MNRKFLALLLSLCLMAGLLAPLAATATETTPATTTATEPTVAETTTATETTASTEPTAPTKPSAVGETRYLKPGTTLYMNPGDTEGYTLKLADCKVEIVAQTGDWYQFRYIGTSLADMATALALGDYTYVKAESTTQEKSPTTAPTTEATTEATTEPTDPNEATEPEGIPACDCADGKDLELGKHGATCPRRAYILDTVIGDRTAQQLRDAWEALDEETQQDLLSVLTAEKPQLLEALKALLEEEEEYEAIFETFTDTTSSGVRATISAREGLFPEGTSVTVTDLDFPMTLSDSGDGALGVVAVDIDFGGAQPGGNVVVSLSIPASRVPSGANMVQIYHFGEEDVELVTTQYLNTASTGKTITFGTGSFSSYAAVFVGGKYSSTKMSTLLANSDTYEIKTFPVDLFNYDPVAMNTALKTAGGTNAFQFRGYEGASGMEGVGGINNSDQMAKQGILGPTLVDGLPVFKYLTNGTEGGKSTGKVLFSDTQAVSGKTIYNNIPFEFIYNKKTGFYEYKSAANHAQLNGNKIELYADTLSTQNNYVATVDLTTFENRYNITGSASNGVYYGQVATGNASRVDPYVSFTLPDGGVEASSVQKIYVKAKIPAGVGKNAFQLFFDNIDNNQYDDVEERSFKVDYTANGDYIEFVVDTSECPKWSGTIYNLRVDLFDSNRAPTDKPIPANTTYNVEISQISLIAEYDDYVTRGGFYPFSEIQDSYPGNNTKFSYSAWAEAMESDTIYARRASRSIFNPSYPSFAALTNELCYGMVMEFDFYIPVGGKVNNQDLEYIFNGDDDLWVFVDNQLVLDIGGGHGAITGTVNFTDKTSQVDGAVTVTGYDTMNGTQDSKQTVTSTLSDALCTPGKHTMKVFYMERCGSVSNCFMKFNLPQTPEGSVQVTKQVQGTDGEAIEALNNVEYTFTITAAPNDSNQPLSLANKEYKEYDSVSKQTTTKTTNASAQFTLTATQTAIFDIAENYKITVTETNPGTANVNGYQWQSVTVNTKDADKDTLVTVKNEAKAFNFVNVYIPLYGQIKITKTGISDLDNDGTTEKQSSVFHVTGTSTTTGETLDLEVVIVGNSSVTIDHVPVGTYTVTEITDWTWRYGTQTAKTAEVKGSDCPGVTFNNVRKKPFWLSGDNWKRNFWGEAQADAATS